MKNIRKNLLINVDCGNDELKFYSNNNMLLAEGYTRVVIGKRGPYIEFEKRHIKWKNFCIPFAEKFRAADWLVYYIEYRSIDPSWVKLYLQRRTVAYADYKIGYCYMAPSDLLREEMQPVILYP